MCKHAGVPGRSTVNWKGFGSFPLASPVWYCISEAELVFHTSLRIFISFKEFHFQMLIIQCYFVLKKWSGSF